MSNTLPKALTRLLEHISTINSVEKMNSYDHYAAGWDTLTKYAFYMLSGPPPSFFCMYVKRNGNIYDA